MTWYRASKKVEGQTILRGTAAPNSSVGSNGQIYLQTIKGEKLDLSTFSLLSESSMDIHKSSDLLSFNYIGGQNIGAQAYKQIDLTDVDEIQVTVDTSSPSYDNYTTQRFAPILIIENNINPASNYPANTSIVSANGETYRVNTQGDSVTFIADVSELTGNYWIVISSIGATTNWYNLYLKSSTYDEVVCDTFAKVNGNWQDLIGTDINDIN